MNNLLPPYQLQHLAKKYDNIPFLRQAKDGEWHSYSYQQVSQMVTQLAQGLIELGMVPGDRVAIFAKNSMEWVVCDWAISLAGCVSVPIFSSADRDAIKYIIEHSEAKLAFVGKLDNYSSYEGVFDGLCDTVAFPYDTISTDKQLSDVLSDKECSFPELDLDHIMTIIYTSGSTGRPKGVVHSYRTFIHGAMNYATDLKDAANLAEERYLSYLPLAHITERVLGAGVWIYADEVGSRVQVSFTESLEKFASNLQDTQPTIFVSVPRLWQKFQSGVFAKLPEKKLNLLLSIPIVSTLIKKKLRTQLGFGSTRVYASGSAPIAPSLLAWYERIGVSICQGWGMTETNACGTTQTPYRSDKRECIGRVLHGMDIRIGEEQEILIKGNAMFLEYYKQPELNAEVFTEDGYFRTGDQGVIDKDGYYRIIGRIKDIFKTDKGKYVAPAPIEAAMAKSTLLEQICVVGSNLPQPVALVVLDESARTLDKTETEASLTELLDEINSDLENHEKMTAIIVLSEPWTVESGLITPTLKIRRQAIEKQFESVYKTKLSSKVVWI